jgi:cysteine desulfurase
MQRIYLDHAATTPLDPRVRAAMEPYWSEQFGNPSSLHRYGQAAAAALEGARREVAAVLGCAAEEISFTAGGSESDNLALRGVLLASRRAGRNHLITTPIEHHAVGHTAAQLRDELGCELTVVPVDGHGRIDPEDVRRAIRPETALISVMLANNEIGTVQPLAAIAAIAREHGVPLHSDAVQAAGQLPLAVDGLGVDLLSLSGHKFYGPKGVGVLYVRRDTPFLPTLTGGGQEGGRRAGTQNVPGIVGLATALRIAEDEREPNVAHYSALRDRLVEGVVALAPDIRLSGHPLERLANNASFVVRGVTGQDLLIRLDLAGIAASSGSACNVGEPEPSEVLLACGLAREWALGALRLTAGRATTAEQIDAAVAALAAIVPALRAASPVRG